MDLNKLEGQLNQAAKPVSELTEKIKRLVPAYQAEEEMFGEAKAKQRARMHKHVVTQKAREAAKHALDEKRKAVADKKRKAAKAARKRNRK